MYLRGTLENLHFTVNMPLEPNSEKMLSIKRNCNPFRYYIGYVWLQNMISIDFERVIFIFVSYTCVTNLHIHTNYHT